MRIHFDKTVNVKSKVEIEKALVFSILLKSSDLLNCQVA
jgi:hypothetical protein